MELQHWETWHTGDEEKLIALVLSFCFQSSVQFIVLMSYSRFTLLSNLLFLLCTFVNLRLERFFSIIPVVQVKYKALQGFIAIARDCTFNTLNPSLV